jgi:hypothetical protein
MIPYFSLRQLKSTFGALNFFVRISFLKFKWDIKEILYKTHTHTHTYTYIYTRWLRHTSLWQNVVSTLSLSVIIFAGRPFPHPTFTGIEVHINGITGITIYITESKIHISYSKTNDSTLFFYYFYISSLAHTIAKGSTFSTSSLFDVTKLQETCLDVSSTGSFPFPM